MSDSIRPTPPTKIRVQRPYASEQAFIQGDFARIGRSTIVLPVALSHPVGQVVRFELVLSGGTVVFRGEGPVVAHHAPGDAKPAGLEIRITRFDARSKSILEHVHALRVSRARTQGGASVDEPIAHAGPSSRPIDVQASLPPPSIPSPPRIPAVQPSPRHATHQWSPAVGAMPPGTASQRPKTVPPPPNRDALLEQLRSRARAMQASGGLRYKTLKT